MLPGAPLAVNPVGGVIMTALRYQGRATVGATVTAAASWVWAKSQVDDRGACEQWLPLASHLRDSAEIAALLWDRWLSPLARRRIAQRTGSEASARALAVFLAGVHDVGKATPVFQSKVRVLAARLEPFGLDSGAWVTADDARQLPHGLAGQLILRRYLTNRGWSVSHADQLGAVVGGHHGIPAEESTLRAAANRPHQLGTAPWSAVQDEFVGDAVLRSGIDLDEMREVALGQASAAVLTGLVIVADWLASNASLFPLVPLGQQPQPDNHRALRAWAMVDLPAPWPAVLVTDDADVLVGDRFGPWQARPVQRAAVEAARGCDLPGLVVIEAAMGEGKTEAALLAVEILAARSGASGCMVALPTQATSNAMFARVVRWLSHVPDATVSATARRHTVSLAHGKAHLDPVFRALRLSSRSTGIGIDEALQTGTGRWSNDPRSIDASVHWWMTSPKKSPLADFVVATIDQLLFVGLQARHAAMRHLGVAGKVVVIDEAHAYDTYMTVYLERVLEWLGAYGVPVVLLSATLPHQVRADLMAAYRRGTEARDTAVRPWAVPQWGVAARASVASPGVSAGQAVGSGLGAASASGSSTPGSPAAAVPYPVVTSIVGGRVTSTGVASSSRRSEVRIELADDSTAAVVEHVATVTREGGCVLVVRNTVARAQATYDAMVARLGADHVTLTHSRFLASDRASTDQWLSTAFGPPGKGERPHRHVVVATQVVEQSLDVDFDLLVTDIAPIDLLLQRIGRMHRHERERPVELASPRCVVVAESWSEVPPRFDHGTAAVYKAYALLQSAALLSQRAAAGESLRLPDDIAPLVEAAYDPQVAALPGWEDAVIAARQEWLTLRKTAEARARAFLLGPPRESTASLNGWLGRSLGEADESANGRAQVRDSEESIEVLVLARAADGTITVPPWVGDDVSAEPLSIGSTPSPDVAQAVAGCALRLPNAVARGQRGDALIDQLSSRWYSAVWERVPELRGQLVMVMDQKPDGSLTTRVGGTEYTYDRTTGLRHTAAAARAETP